MIQKKYFALFFVLFWAFITPNKINAQATNNKIMAEKTTFQIPNKMLHPSIRDESKSATEIQVIIPTDLNTDNAWPFRAWGSDYINEEAVALLELAISFGANQFVISTECLLKSTPENLEKLHDYCKEYNVTLIAKSPLFGMPINTSDLEALTAISKSNIISAIIFDFKTDFFLDENPTQELLELLISRIANKKLKLISKNFGSPAYFSKAVNHLKLTSATPITAHNPSLVADINPQIKRIEGGQIIFWDASLSEFGKNKNLAILSDYIGYRMTQLLSLEKPPLGVWIDFKNTETSFGTINEVNNYCINQLMLNKKKDVDYINHEWFSSKFGEENSLKTLGVFANSLIVIRNTNYISNLPYPIFLNDDIVSPITLLQNSELKKWLPTSQQKEPLKSWAYRDKVLAKEAIKQIAERAKGSISEIKDAKDIASLIKAQQETTDKALLWTELLLTAMTTKITSEHATWKKYASRYKEDLDKTYLKDFVEAFIKNNADYIDLIPDENKPSYLTPNE